MPAFSVPVTPDSLCPGTVVSVWVFPFFRHKGIVSDRYFGDKPMVISNSARVGAVAEEAWDVFADGQTVHIEGYPSDLASWIVVNRARAYMEAKYDLLTWNCEHLASYAHGLVPRSPQVAFIITAALLAGILTVAAD